MNELQISSEKPAKKALIPFLSSAVIWILISTAVCFHYTESGAVRKRALAWMFGLVALSLLDLLALGKVMAAVFELQTPDLSDVSDLRTRQKRTFSVIRASYWGAIKIACILIFGTILVKGSRNPAGIPSVGLLTGVTTLVFVPLLGGIIWYLRSGNSAEEQG